MNFTDQELLLINRAMILLSCVVDGRDSTTCLKIAEKVVREYNVNKMLMEDEHRRQSDEK
jgi:hypothetical protein